MYEVVGFKDVDFVDKSSNDKIQGCTVFVVFEEDSDKKLIGRMSDKIFLPLNKFEDVCNQIKVGMFLDITYNRFGKVSSVSIL